MGFNIEADNFLIMSKAVQKRICKLGLCSLCNFLDEYIVLETEGGRWICTDNMEKHILKQLKRVIKPKNN
ncbi:hypothetical protein LCGC14_2915770 [marine sediment metagenome]|uniref:Uncharacterized protein n=1 Tax=marine sediment metagenome TaxID=412755 RepID=A0A0F8ZXW8_9ZZZZ